MIISNPVAPYVVGISPSVRSGNPVAQAISALRHGHPNMLVIGDDDEVDRLLERIRPRLVTPIACWRPRDGSTGPCTPFRTLIVRGLDDLRQSQHARLAELNADAQIISTASAPLFPAVQSGAFPDGLYYRLNAVLIHVSAVPEN